MIYKKKDNDRLKFINCSRYMNFRILKRFGVTFPNQQLSFYPIGHTRLKFPLGMTHT